MQVPLGKGVFLIAAPSLRDPNFRQTVVLLCEHGPEGALGVVVNRPTAMSISEALPHVPVAGRSAPTSCSREGPRAAETKLMVVVSAEIRLPDNSHSRFSPGRSV